MGNETAQVRILVCFFFFFFFWSSSSASSFCLRGEQKILNKYNKFV